MGVCSKVRNYRRAPSKGLEDKPPTWSLSEGFFKGKNKEAGTNHHLVTVLWHFLIVVLRISISLVYDSLARWFMALGFVSSSCPGETTWVRTLMMVFILAILVMKDVISNSNFSHLTGWLVFSYHRIAVRGDKKGSKFRIKKLLINLVRELCFGGLGVTVAMLHIRSSDLIHLRAESMYPLSTSLHFSAPPLSLFMSLTCF